MLPLPCRKRWAYDDARGAVWPDAGHALQRGTEMADKPRTQMPGKMALAVVAIVVTIGIGWTAFQMRRARNDRTRETKSISAKSSGTDRAIPEFVTLSESTVRAMRLKTTLANVPRFSKILHLRGSLAIDSNLQSHIHARFPGQVVELATTKGLKSQMPQSTDVDARPLQYCDVVEAGFPMAIIWSKDLGEKKSQLADSLAKLRVEKETAKNLLGLAKEGGISDRELREQKAKVEQLVIAAFSAEATLRAYQVAEADIKQVKDSAEKIHLSQETDKSYALDWPRVIVTSPIAGVIVEKNVTVGEIVDANAELFKVADISSLAVWLHPYEEDLPALEQLPKPLHVSIKVPAHPELGEIPGEVDRFSPMIDPNEHMALLVGTVKNPGILRANQFITADVGIPIEPGVVEIPANAVIDVGTDAVVYIQTDAAVPKFHRRRVRIVQRYFEVVYVRSELSDEQKSNGLQEVRVGDSVVAGGLLELEDFSQQQR